MNVGDVLAGPWKLSPNTIDQMNAMAAVLGDLMLRIHRLEVHVSRLEHFYPTNGHAERIHVDQEHTCPNA